jgi:hypothetical protein
MMLTPPSKKPRGAADRQPSTHSRKGLMAYVANVIEEQLHNLDRHRRAARRHAQRRLLLDRLGVSLFPGGIVPSGTERIDTISGAKAAVGLLFREIEKHHGWAVTRRMFATVGAPLTAAQHAKFANWALLDRLDKMKPKSNIKQLTRELHAEGGGPRGRATITSIQRHIERQVRIRREAIRKNQWWGPVTPAVDPSMPGG